MKSFILFTAALFTTLFLQAQTFKANISQLAFMKGKWVTNHEWGSMEEFWGAPIGNNMVSTYRCVKNSKVLFYEFVVIEQSDSVPVMLLRHFNAGSIGWEDKNAPQYYPLINIGKNKAVFQSADKTITLTYELISSNKLDVTLNEKNKDGKMETTPFHYTLSKN